MRRNSCFESTAPLGFEGELMMTSLVLGVMCRSIIAAVTSNPLLSSVSDEHAHAAGVIHDIFISDPVRDRE